MEDTLRAMTKREEREFFGLNPCFNGRYSQREKKSLRKKLRKS